MFKKKPWNGVQPFKQILKNKSIKLTKQIMNEGYMEVLFHHAFCSLIGSKSQPLIVSSNLSALYISVVATIYLFFPVVVSGAS